jgi:excisionase family DNA binding protein
MTDEKITISEAAKLLGKSARTVRRYVQEGKLEATLENGKYMVSHDAVVDLIPGQILSDTDRTSDQLLLVDNLRSRIESLSDQVTDLRSDKQRLQQQNEQLQAQVGRLQQQVEEASQRHDTIVLQLTQRLGEHQKLLEYRTGSWLSRFRRRKREPAAVNVVDQE